MSGQVDCAVITDSARPLRKGYEATPCLRNVLGLAVAANHPLAERRPLTVRDLDGQRILCYERAQGYWPMVQEMLNRSDLRANELLSIESLEALKSLTAQGMGIAFYPLVTVLDEVNRGDLVFRPVELAGGRLMELDTWFCFGRTHALRREIIDLREIVLECGRELQGRLDAALTRNDWPLVVKSRRRSGRSGPGLASHPGPPTAEVVSDRAPLGVN